MARKGALFAAAGLLALGSESLVAHFAGQGDWKWPQAVPPLTGAALALTILTATRWARGATFARIMRLVGGASALVGLVGEGLHVTSFVRTLASDPLTWKNLVTTLSLAPPPFAPLSFVGVGILLFVLPSVTAVKQLPEWQVDRTGPAETTPPDGH